MMTSDLYIPNLCSQTLEPCKFELVTQRILA